MLIIDRPVITEKSLAKAAEGVYSFFVVKAAGKPQIAAAIERLFEVKVESVRIQSTHGKIMRRRTGLGKEGDYKKAIVKLAKGSTIKSFELPAEVANTDKTDSKNVAKDRPAAQGK